MFAAASLALLGAGFALAYPTTGLQQRQQGKQREFVNTQYY
jgi:hypothetical protein